MINNKINNINNKDTYAIDIINNIFCGNYNFGSDNDFDTDTNLGIELPKSNCDVNICVEEISDDNCSLTENDFIELKRCSTFIDSTTLTENIKEKTAKMKIQIKCINHLVVFYKVKNLYTYIKLTSIKDNDYYKFTLKKAPNKEIQIVMRNPRNILN